MKVITSSAALDELLTERRSFGHHIGFVPTMGALHEGHISLINHAKSENNVVVCSIFVNPTQFNDPKDFERYPRQLELDNQILLDSGCDVSFVPGVRDVYPKPDAAKYLLGEAASRLEGAYRPGHFNGVASVVKRLFELVRPHKAYFGRKDYQQYLTIKSLVTNYDIPVEIVGCETVRSANGLALSSRNQLLQKDELGEALHLYQALMYVKSAYQSGQSSMLESLGKHYLLKQEAIDLEYFDIADAQTLSKIGDAHVSPGQEALALVAAKVGRIRLIDNMLLTQTNSSQNLQGA